MTKNPDLQKELNEKVIPGVKPSEIRSSRRTSIVGDQLKKKLKKSKSADDITNISPADNSNTTLAAELKKANDLLQDQLKEKQAEFNNQLKQINSLFDPQAINYTQPIEFNGLYQHLKELLTNTPPNILLQEQLKTKQTEIENLRQELETTNQKLTETTAELDNSLEIRANNLKEWNQQQEIIKKLNKELDQTVEEASEEINANDSEISQLRTKFNQLKTVKEQLERDLKLERIKKGTNPQPINSATDNFLPTSFYALLVLSILFLATNITVSVTAPNEH